MIDRPAAADRKVTQIPRGFLSVPGVEFYAGVAYSPDGNLIYVAAGDSGAVDVLTTADWHRIARISLNGPVHGHVYKESFAAKRRPTWRILTTARKSVRTSRGSRHPCRRNQRPWLIRKNESWSNHLKMQSDVSHVATGFKSLLLKPLAAFFKKKDAGAVVPIAITGFPQHYKIVQNIIPH